MTCRTAGWDVSNSSFVSEELPVTGMPLSTNRSGTGKVDYVLWDETHKPIAIVEAKRTSKDAKNGLQQALLYADCIEQEYGVRPFIFLTNGYDTFFIDDFKGYKWDKDKSGYPKRKIFGFFSRAQLVTLRYRRTEKWTWQHWISVPRLRVDPINKKGFVVSPNAL